VTADYKILDTCFFLLRLSEKTPIKDSVMPGIIMDKTSGPWRSTSTHNVNNNGISSLPYTSETDGTSLDLKIRSRYLNGSKERDRFGEDGTALVEKITASDSPSTSQLLPELVHITHGFFPFSHLVNRSVQQCWNDLSDLTTELADVQALVQNQVSRFGLANGKSPGNQSEENMQKKLRVLDFAQLKRTEFIKLLVLSRWSRQALDVSKLIDLQGFIRTRHQAYLRAPQRVADMKRDLVRAQIANPDLKTALEVLSKGRTGIMLNVSNLSSFARCSANFESWDIYHQSPCLQEGCSIH
jgi:mediator of RNA polymerase II transcription subunit 14